VCTPSFAVESVLRLAGADLDLKQFLASSSRIYENVSG